MRRAEIFSLRSLRRRRQKPPKRYPTLKSREPSRGRKPRHPASRRRLSLALAAAIVIAALVAVGGAFGLHMLDGRRRIRGARMRVVAALEQRSGSRPQGLRRGANKIWPARRRRSRPRAATRKRRARGLARRSRQTRGAKVRLPSAAARADLAPLEARLGALEEKFAALDAKVGGFATKLDVQNRQARASKTARANRPRRAPTAKPSRSLPRTFCAKWRQAPL